MRKIKFIYLIALFGILSNNIYSQTDSLGNEKVKLSRLIYLGLGGGFCVPGGMLGFRGTYISTNDWGGSINFITNWIKVEDLPPDYYSRVFSTPPHNWVVVGSFNILKEFSKSYFKGSIKKSQRYGIEGGPSWVMYSLAEIKPNPNYGQWWTTDKYWLSHTARNTVGISLRGKIDFSFNEFIGCELAAYTNINSLHSLFGIEFYFNFGKVR